MLAVNASPNRLRRFSPRRRFIVLTPRWSRSKKTPSRRSVVLGAGCVGDAAGPAWGAKATSAISDRRISRVATTAGCKAGRYGGGGCQYETFCQPCGVRRQGFSNCCPAWEAIGTSHASHPQAETKSNSQTAPRTGCLHLLGKGVGSLLLACRPWLGCRFTASAPRSSRSKKTPGPLFPRTRPRWGAMQGARREENTGVRQTTGQRAGRWPAALTACGS